MILSCLLGIAIASSPNPAFVPFLTIRKFDFLQSKPVTDADQFYREENGQPKPAGNGKYPGPEYNWYAPTSPKNMRDVPYIVDKRGSTQLIEITWYNPLGYAVSGTWDCDGAIFERTSKTPSQTYYFTWVIGDHTLNLPAGGTATVFMFVTGLPDVVCKGTISIGVNAFCPPISGYEGHINTLYLTDEAPAGHQSTPWAEVLDNSCVWADGEVGKVPCLTKCTKGLFNSGLFSYDLIDCHHIGKDEDSSDYGKFALKEWATGQGSNLADCRDTSSFLLLSTSAIGHSGNLVTAYVPGDPVVRKFHTNPVRAIGTPSYSAIDWNYHQFFEESSSVYDACAAQYYHFSGGLYQDVPVGWPTATYWQTYTPTGYFGLANGYWDQYDTAVTDQLFIPARVFGPFSPSAPTLLQGVF